MADLGGQYAGRRKKAAAAEDNQAESKQVSLHVDSAAWKQIRFIALEHDVSASSIVSGLINAFLASPVAEQQRIIRDAEQITETRAAKRTRWGQ